MPSFVFGVLLDMFDRVTNAVKSVWGGGPKKHSSRLPQRHPPQRPPPAKRSRPRPKTPAQVSADAQRQRVNAEQFVSNGILVETVEDDDEGSCSAQLITDLEAGTEAVLPSDGNTGTDVHPYHDPRRMTTVMEPLT